jgi:enoyl-CoA hydratase
MFTGDSISGKKAEEIGLVAKAVPEDKLEEEVNKLARRIALVGLGELITNKMAINSVIEEMGLRNALDTGFLLDTIAHTTPPVQDFTKRVREKGLKEALAENEAPFRETPRATIMDD